MNTVETDSEELAPDAEAPQASWRQKLKFTIFSFSVVGFVLAGFELSIRVSGLDQPELSTPLLPVLGEGFRLVHRNDDELFYSLRPNIQESFWGVPLTTNSLGLRTPEVGPKEPNEFRILSLGESSTFGAGVLDDEPYSALLELHLSRADASRKYRVINAGVSAYSSFQSTKYLEKRGLKLKPDMLLIYHELADFLPTTNRDSLAPDSVGLPLSDKELYYSKRHRLNRQLLESSAIFRLISYQLVKRKVRDFQTDGSIPEADHITIPEQLLNVSTPEGVRAFNLPPRVPLEQRQENLNRMMTLCRENGIQFVVIHPSYGESDRHECDLTEFCMLNNVPMFEAYDSLHPAEPVPGGLYGDLWHPNAEGHERMAEDLFQFLKKHELVPLPH